MENKKKQKVSNSPDLKQELESLKKEKANTRALLANLFEPS